ncbi:MAG: hypothetical protein QM726_12910 [Chitinophagaceae bacterium]
MKRILHLAFLMMVVFIGLFSFSANAQKQGSVLFGRGTYPGDDSSFLAIRNAGFSTFILSSFYIKANGDVVSGDDGRHPIIQNGRFTGSNEWISRVASLRNKKHGINRIEILLEGRWFNQAPNTYDFIRDWLDSNKAVAGVVPGTSDSSTMYGILKIFKEVIGADAICIDDESVYDSVSIVRLGQMAKRAGMKMSLCPYTRTSYWKYIMDNSAKGLVDNIYLQCYDGGKNNTPGPWITALGDKIPLYPIFLCRGAFSTCKPNHNSKTPEEISLLMQQYKKEYPGLPGGGIWQMQDIKDFVRKNCSVTDPSSGTASSVVEYLEQLKNAVVKF